MKIEAIHMEPEQVRKLLGAASADGALLYIYLRAGNLPEHASQALNMPQSRISCAMATLRQLGLWPEETRSTILPGERPAYSENDVIEAMDHEASFRLLRGEVQRLLGRNLNTEDLKILLGFVHYLGLPTEVIS